VAVECWHDATLKVSAAALWCPTCKTLDPDGAATILKLDQRYRANRFST